MRFCLPFLVILSAVLAIGQPLVQGEADAEIELPWTEDEAKEFIRPGMRFVYTRRFYKYTGSTPRREITYVDVLSTSDQNYTIETRKLSGNDEIVLVGREQVGWSSIAEFIDSLDGVETSDFEFGQYTIHLYEWSEGEDDPQLSRLALSAECPGLYVFERRANQDAPFHDWKRELTEVFTKEEAKQERDDTLLASPWKVSEAKAFLRTGTAWRYSVTGPDTSTVTYRVAQADDESFTLEIETATEDGTQSESVEYVWEIGTRWLWHSEDSEAADETLTVDETEYDCLRVDHAQGATWYCKEFPLVFARRTAGEGETAASWELVSITEPETD